MKFIFSFGLSFVLLMSQTVHASGISHLEMRGANINELQVNQELISSIENEIVEIDNTLKLPLKGKRFSRREARAKRKLTKLVNRSLKGIKSIEFSNPSEVDAELLGLVTMVKDGHINTRDEVDRLIFENKSAVNALKNSKNKLKSLLCVLKKVGVGAVILISVGVLIASGVGLMVGLVWIFSSYVPGIILTAGALAGVGLSFGSISFMPDFYECE